MASRPKAATSEGRHVSARSAHPQQSPLARLTAAIQEAAFPQSAFSLKSAGSRTGEYVGEESFDLKMQNLTYLEAVRLLTRLSNGPLPVVIRSANLKSRFDDSKYLDATIRIGFLLPATR